MEIRQKNDSQIQPNPETIAQDQAVYEPVGIPTELPSKKGGKLVGIFSIICAVLSLIMIPILFGPLGIILGVSAKIKGENTLGLIGVIISAVFMVIGIILGVILRILEKNGLIPSAAIFFGL